VTEDVEVEVNFCNIFLIRASSESIRPGCRTVTKNLPQAHPNKDVSERGPIYAATSGTAARTFSENSQQAIRGSKSERERAEEGKAERRGVWCKSSLIV
jgi:hypothetical protein